MSTDPADLLASLLALTQDDEMDCDAFAEHVAAYVDGGGLHRDILAQVEYHRLVCGECDEHVQRLVAALSLTFPAGPAGC